MTVRGQGKDKTRTKGGLELDKRRTREGQEDIVALWRVTHCLGKKQILYKLSLLVGTCSYPWYGHLPIPCSSVVLMFY